MENNYVMTFFIGGTIFFVVLVFFFTFFILLYKQKRNKMVMEKQLSVFHEQERTMTQVSKEVHDNLGAMLNFAMMNMQVIRDYASHDAQRDAIETSSGIISQLIAEVQDISHSMNSEFIKRRGLYDILEEQLRNISSTQRLECSVEETGSGYMLQADQELLVFRIAQEAIRNAIKHARATHLKITLSSSPDMFVMTVTDNGQGFIKEEVEEANGLGFMSMRERANILNGKLEIEAAPDNGCTISVKVPQKA